MTLTSTLVGTCLSKLPARAGPDALTVARRCLIDSLACACAAADEQPVTITVRTQDGP